MRISDWISDVCSSDDMASLNMAQLMSDDALKLIHIIRLRQETAVNPDDLSSGHKGVDFGIVDQQHLNIAWVQARSEEHTSELQSLMRISYAVFCLKKKKYSSIYDELLKSQK